MAHGGQGVVKRLDTIGTGPGARSHLTIVTGVRCSDHTEHRTLMSQERLTWIIRRPRQALQALPQRHRDGRELVELDGQPQGVPEALQLVTSVGAETMLLAGVSSRTPRARHQDTAARPWGR